MFLLNEYKLFCVISIVSIQYSITMEDKKDVINEDLNSLNVSNIKDIYESLRSTSNTHVKKSCRINLNKMHKMETFDDYIFFAWCTELVEDEYFCIDLEYLKESLKIINSIRIPGDVFVDPLRQLIKAKLINLCKKNYVQRNKEDEIKELNRLDDLVKNEKCYYESIGNIEDSLKAKDFDLKKKLTLPCKIENFYSEFLFCIFEKYRSLSLNDPERYFKDLLLHRLSLPYSFGIKLCEDIQKYRKGCCDLEIYFGDECNKELISIMKCHESDYYRDFLEKIIKANINGKEIDKKIDEYGYRDGSNCKNNLCDIVSSGRFKIYENDVKSEVFWSERGTIIGIENKSENKDQIKIEEKYYTKDSKEDKKKYMSKIFTNDIKDKLKRSYIGILNIDEINFYSLVLKYIIKDEIYIYDKFSESDIIQKLGEKFLGFNIKKNFIDMFGYESVKGMLECDIDLSDISLYNHFSNSIKENFNYISKQFNYEEKYKELFDLDKGFENFINKDEGCIIVTYENVFIANEKEFFFPIICSKNNGSIESCNIYNEKEYEKNEIEYEKNEIKYEKNEIKYEKNEKGILLKELTIEQDLKEGYNIKKVSLDNASLYQYFWEDKSFFDIRVYIQKSEIEVTKNARTLYKLKFYIKNRDFSYMFYRNYDVIKIEFSKIDGITSMAYMFSECCNLQVIKGLHKLDTSKVKDMQEMFNNCGKLRQISDISCWNTENVTSMFRMFRRCKKFEYLPDISKWNTSNVTDLRCMFSRCKRLRHININSWDISKVESTNFMFSNCENLEDLPDPTNDQDEKLNINSIKSAKGMFRRCKKFTKIPKIVYKFKKVENLSYIFYKCDRIVIQENFVIDNFEGLKEIYCMFSVLDNSKFLNQLKNGFFVQFITTLGDCESD